MKTALIKKQEQNEWLEFISRLGLVNLRQAREVFLSGEYNQIKDLGQKALYTAGRGKTLSLEGNLIGSKITLDEAQHLAETYNAERDFAPKDEILSYVHYEKAVFWAKFSEKLNSLSLFRSAKRLAESESLNSIIDYQISALQLRHDPSSSPREVLGWIKYFSDKNMRVMQLIASRQLAVYYRMNEDYTEAENLLLSSLELAIDFDYWFMVEQVKSSQAFILYRRGLYDESRKLLHSMLEDVESKYLKATVLENLTLTFYDEGEYDVASKYLDDAIEHSQKYDILAQLAEECLFMGDLYREKLGQPELATYYYDIGSAAALKMAEHGFSLKGDRLAVINRFENRPKTGYSIPETITPRVDQFAFAIGRSWKDINDIFQYFLISSHLTSGTDVSELPEKFNLKVGTYYAIKRRLGQHGYHLDQENSETLSSFKQKHLTAFRKHVVSYLDLTWSDANQRFEKEIIEYLFKQVGYQKTKLADELDVSYPTILQKTKSLAKG